MKRHILLMLLMVAGLTLSVQSAVAQNYYLNGQKVSEQDFYNKMEGSKGRLNNNTISIDLLKLFDHTLKIDYERKLTSTKSVVFTISGTAFGLRKDDIQFDNGYYSGDGISTFSSSFDEFDKLKGFGLGVAYKEMFSERSMFYYQLGVKYDHFVVSYVGSGFNYFTDTDGLTKYEFGYRFMDNRYNKFSGNANIGFQIAAGKFYFDSYIGIGGSYSFYKKVPQEFFDGGNYYSNRRGYDEPYVGMFGFGYRGFYPIIGIKMGITFN